MMIENDEKHNLEITERPFINGDRLILPTSERHGFVTGWLRFGLIINLIIVLAYLFIANKPIHLPKVSIVTAYCIIIVATLNVIFFIRLLSWKKNGFYGICITSVITIFINLNIGISPMMALLGLPGITILYGILQIKKGGVSAWSYMK